MAKLEGNLQNILNHIIGCLKWPIAIVTVLILPATVLECWRLLALLVEDHQLATPLLMGAAAYIILWKLIFSRTIWGTWFSTLEHELTHVLFALLTFHKVTGFQITYNQGGRMRYEGSKSWLISISPYFFPTFSVLLVITLSLVPDDKLFLTCVVLGGSISYHLISNIKQLHTAQTDLIEVGLPFVILFLPTANLLCYSGVLAFAYGGLPQVAELLQVIKGTTLLIADMFQRMNG